MRPRVPPAFLLAWAGLGLVVEGTRWAYGLGMRLGLEWGTPLWWAEFVLFAGAVGFGEAFFQSRLLRRFGRPVPRWTAVVGAGTWGLSILHTALYALAMPTAGMVLDSWTFVASQISEEAAWALATSVIMGAAVWGRRWEGPWMLWITARTGVALAVGVAAASLPLMAYFGGVRLDYTLIQAVQAGLRVTALGAATAWLLWRLVLPPRSGVPAGAEA